MKLIRRLFLSYVALLALGACAYGVSRFFAPPRDPNTMFTIYIGTIRSLDPTIIADQTSGDIMGHVYECLYNYRYGGKPDELFPQVAADLPKISEDRLTYTIPIRKGIHFYDPKGRLKEIWPTGVGPEVTAGDIVYSWKRMADFHNAAPSYSTVLQDNVVGLDAFRDYTEKADKDKVDYDRPVEGLSAPDEHTLVVKLTKPIPNFPQLTAYLGMAATSRQAVEWLYKHGYDGMKEYPVATGPYYVEEYLNDQRITLTKNPAYRGRPDVDGEEGKKLPEAERLPHIARIQYDYVLEQLPAWFLFRQKRYDVITIPKEVYGGAVVNGKINPELAKDGVELKKRTDLGLWYMLCNMTDPVIGKNKPLRQAMSLAIDRAKFVRVYRNDRGVPATGMFPPDAALFDPKYSSPWVRFDVEAAKAKVKEAEAINGGPLPLLHLQMDDSGTDERQYAEFFCRCWADVGLKVQPEYTTYAHYLELLDAKNYQVTFTGWVPDYPDEKTYLRLFDATLADPPGSNAAGYRNPDYQALLTPSLSLPRGPERDKLYLKMRDILDDDLPAIALYYSQTHSMRYDWMGNYKHPMFTAGFYAYQTLDVEMRRRALRGDVTPAPTEDGDGGSAGKGGGAAGGAR